MIAMHELAHGFTCKHFGGEVHEIGAMMFYFDLAFFCNVNDAWTFPELKSRLWVTAAGSWIEMSSQASRPSSGGSPNPARSSRTPRWPCS